ncbi:FGGY family carbohydrate kinase [Solirubrobacter soli]|uniref:FGGY family carbohydrate kinase n=1 Tax=Solirubrobacter soli TaxID=363832 RepID=UPI000410AA9D|nr:FGGY family carbohydrate kinase [Solirubrobacter soli]
MGSAEIDNLALGLDVGTTALKAAVVDASGNEIAHGRAPTPWQGNELDPDALLRAALDAIEQALDGRRVTAIGIASMAETGVLTDDALRPVVPSIAWWDERGAEEAAELAALPDFSARTGLPPTSMCTLAKYGWMRRNWPEAKRGTRWFNVAEWIVLGLGGESRPEASLASRTGFYDLHTGEAWAPAMTWADAPASLAPPHAPAGTPMGRARVSTLPSTARESRHSRGGARSRSGLAGIDGARLAVGGHDHAAAAVGAGAAGEGDVLDSCGTAEAILRATAPLDPGTVARAVADGFTVGRHAVPGRSVLQGATWSGEKLQAVIDGYGEESSEYRIALEEVGAAGADILARMERLAGPYTRLVITGGWSDRAEVREMKRRHLGAFEHVAEGFAGCRGAARAARQGS